MKLVVLTEGKRDVKLVEQFYELSGRDIRIDKFIGEDVEYSRLKNQESQSIRNFLENRNPYDVLAKSENGKTDLKRVFIKLINFLISTEADVCLLIDLDTSNHRGADSHRELVDELDERVSSNYEGQDLSISWQGFVRRNNALSASENQFYVNDHCRGDFNILAFHSSLENEVDITGEESEGEEQQKLREFVQDDLRSEPLRHVF